MQIRSSKNLTKAIWICSVTRCANCCEGIHVNGVNRLECVFYLQNECCVEVPEFFDKINVVKT
jgi:hypothetical protein